MKIRKQGDGRSTPQAAQDEALFEALGKSKKKKKRKIIRTFIIVILILAIILVSGTAILQRRVREQFAMSDVEVLSYNEETQEYGGRVDVVTGLSNNNYVEIKSGLSVGQTVYYTEKQTIGNMFGNMGFGNMGSMPGSSGGGMPDFGGSGGGTPSFGGSGSGMPSGMPSGGSRPSGSGGRG